MNDFRKTPTERLWSAIVSNAQLAQKHTGWIEYLDNIKVLCALIDERIEVFQRMKRTEGLLRQHRGEFRLATNVQERRDDVGAVEPGPKARARELKRVHSRRGSERR